MSFCYTCHCVTLSFLELPVNNRISDHIMYWPACPLSSKPGGVSNQSLRVAVWTVGQSGTQAGQSGRAKVEETNIEWLAKHPWACCPSVWLVVAPKLRANNL